MLDREAKLTVLAFVLAMLVSAIWLVGHTAHWSTGPFIPPACVMIVVGLLQWRFAHAEGDLSAWRKLGDFLAISYAAMCTGFQLFLVMKVLKVTALPASSVIRVLLACYGLQLLVIGNWTPKLPPLKMWRPAFLSLDMAGEAAILRFGGWIFVASGLIVIASSALIPMTEIAPLIGSMSLASLIVVLIRQRQLKG
jgi:hypothetical protein